MAEELVSVSSPICLLFFKVYFLHRTVLVRPTSLPSDGNIKTRVNCHKSLYLIGDLPAGLAAIVSNQLVPVLINLLRTEDNMVRIWIIQTMAKLLRIAAIEALENDGLEALINLLDVKEDEAIVEFALRAIGEITYPVQGKIKANNHSRIDIS